jgi:acyl-coenzyme A thioesterase PaaI-like protein
MTEALFTLDGDTVVPTEYARGPWDAGSLHGGPVAALLARSVEHAREGGTDLDVTRLTVELLRPVPLEPLHVHVEIARPGRKVQLVEASLTVASSGVEVARSRALRIRRAEVVLPHDDPALTENLRPEPSPPPPQSARFEDSTWAPELVAFHKDGTEHRFVAGTWAEPGPVTVWIRLRVPVVAGEIPSGVQRAVAAADFANGVARVLPFETHVFINPDLTVNLLRPPQGEWVCLQARTHLGPDGYGLAESALFDVRGRVGRSVQSLLVDRR